MESKVLPSVDRTLEDRGDCGAKARAGAMAEEQIAAMKRIDLTILFYFGYIRSYDCSVCMRQNAIV